LKGPFGLYEKVGVVCKASAEMEVRVGCWIRWGHGQKKGNDEEKVLLGEDEKESLGKRTLKTLNGSKPEGTRWHSNSTKRIYKRETGSHKQRKGHWGGKGGVFSIKMRTGLY